MRKPSPKKPRPKSARMKKASLPPAPSAAPPAGAPRARWILAGWSLAVFLLLQYLYLARLEAMNIAVVGGITFICFAFLAFGGRAWITRRVETLSTDRLLLSGLLPLIAVFAVCRSGSRDNVKDSTMAAYALVNLLWAYAVMGPRWDRDWRSASSVFLPPPREDLAAPRKWAWVLGLSALLAAGVLAARRFAFSHLVSALPSNAIFMFFYSRAKGVESFPAGLFTDYGKLAVPGACLAAFLILAYFLVSREARTFRRGWMAFLCAAAFVGKFTIASLSVLGIQTLSTKIASVHTAYYNLASRIDQMGMLDFMRRFNEIRIVLLTHGETHPFGPEILYWLFIRLLGHRPDLIAYLMMLLCSLTVIPVFKTAEDYFGDSRAGFAAAALYLTSPISLILSGAGIDGLVCLFFAVILYLCQSAALRRDWRPALAAGVAFFLCSLLTVGVVIFGLFCVLWMVFLGQRRAQGPADWLGQAALQSLAFGGTVLLLHGLLYLVLGGQFSYLQLLLTCAQFQGGMSTVRPYSVWMWLNGILYAGYAGLPLVAILFLRLTRQSWKLSARDGLLWLSASFLLTILFTSLGNAEVQRIFVYAILFFALPAAAYFLEDREGRTRLNTPLLTAVLALNFINAVVLEMFVQDYW